jgi:hypothetical protein
VAEHGGGVGGGEGAAVSLGGGAGDADLGGRLSGW